MVKKEKQMLALKVMKDLSEQVSYENPQFPVYISKAELFSYYRMQAACHWHDDVELLMPLKGYMTYSINDKLFHIKTGDAVFVNAQQLHYGFSEDGSNCEYICITFSPEAVISNQYLVERYVVPITQNISKTEHMFCKENKRDQKLLFLIRKIYQVNQQKGFCYELSIMQILCDLWMELYGLIGEEKDLLDTFQKEEYFIQKKMLKFIYDNYEKKLTLNDICGAGGVGRTKCCQMFQKYLHSSPISFLNGHRLQISMKLLRETQYNITEISYACGFENPGYYAELFKRYKGCTPREFRKDVLSD